MSDNKYGEFFVLILLLDTIKWSLDCNIQSICTLNIRCISACTSIDYSRHIFCWLTKYKCRSKNTFVQQNCIKLCTVTSSLKTSLMLKDALTVLMSIVIMDVPGENNTVSSKWLDNLMNYSLTVESKDKLCTYRQAFWVSILFLF